MSNEATLAASGLVTPTADVGGPHRTRSVTVFSHQDAANWTRTHSEPRWSRRTVVRLLDLPVV